MGKLKVYTFFFLFLASFLLLSLGKNQEKKTIPLMNKTFIKDGLPNEWELDINFYNSSAKIKYGIKNDSDNIYFIFQTWDIVTQYKLLHSKIDVFFHYKFGQQKRTRAFSIGPLITHGRKQDILGNNQEDYSEQIFESFSKEFNDRNLKTRSRYLIQRKNKIADTRLFHIPVANWDTQANIFYEFHIPLKEVLDYNQEFLRRFKDTKIIVEIKIRTLDRTLHQFKGYRIPIDNKDDLKVLDIKKRVNLINDEGLGFHRIYQEQTIKKKFYINTSNLEL